MFSKFKNWVKKTAKTVWSWATKKETVEEFDNLEKVVEKAKDIVALFRKAPQPATQG